MWIVHHVGTFEWPVAIETITYLNTHISINFWFTLQPDLLLELLLISQLFVWPIRFES